MTQGTKELQERDALAARIAAVLCERKKDHRSKRIRKPDCRANEQVGLGLYNYSLSSRCVGQQDKTHLAFRWNSANGGNLR
jgi:hypothetical protein